MKRREYLKTACEDEVNAHAELLKPMLNDLRSEFGGHLPKLYLEVEYMTVHLTLGTVPIIAYLTNDVVEVNPGLPAAAEKLIKLAIPYWLNQEAEDCIVCASPRKPITMERLEAKFKELADALPAHDTFIVYLHQASPPISEKQQAYYKNCVKFISSEEISLEGINKIGLYRYFDAFDIIPSSSHDLRIDMPGKPCVFINGDTLHYQCDVGNDW